MTPAGRALLGGLLGGALAAALILTGSLEFLELKALDSLFRLRGVRPPRAPIVIVAIDEDTFKALNLEWPFPRALHGRLIDKLSTAAPAVIGVDILFAEASVKGRADDEALASAVARAGNVVLAAATGRLDEKRFVWSWLAVPHETIGRGAAAVGSVSSLGFDRNGFVRWATLRTQLRERSVPSFEAQLHRLAASAGVPTRPLPDASEILINFRGGPGTFPWIPYHRVMRDEVPPEAIRGKIVLVGGTTPPFLDTYSTPFAPTKGMPGIEVRANVLETLLNGDHLREAPVRLGAAIAMVAALFAAGLVARLREWALAVVLVLLVAVGLGTVLLFWLWDIWFRPVGVILAVIFGLVSAMAFTLQRGRPR